MSLNFNNTQIENIIFNGTELDKVYMNNVLVFEKSKSIYKRRIMVGDNLNSKILYGDFYTNLYNDLYEDETAYWETPIATKNGNIIAYKYNNMAIIEGDSMFQDTHYAYYWDGSTEENKTPINISSDKDYTVTSIKDCPAYRCLFIEDINIRPIQIGDRIKTGTKMYFNFPDKFSDKEKNTFSNGDCGFRIVELNDSISYIYELYISKGTINNDPNGEEYFEFSLDFLNDSGNWVEENRTDSYIYVENPKYNQSYLFFSNNLLGEIGDIHSTLKKYILVDTTTLG